MTFYDTDRIARKNEKYEKIKAYGIIDKLKSKKMSRSEMLSALDILINDDNTEFHQGVLERAKKIVECQDEENENEKNHEDVDNRTGGSDFKHSFLPILLD